MPSLHRDEDIQVAFPEELEALVRALVREKSGKV
jgi:hypothetical protein